jgi:alkyl hydroperoxide reductase subunit AhpC
VEVIALNMNASMAWLQFYAPDTIYIKDAPVTLPMLFDSTGATFENYGAAELLLPSVFVIDQAGIIRLRADGIKEPEPFEEEMTSILAMIDELIANPPEE